MENEPLTAEEYQQLLDLGGLNQELANKIRMQMAQAESLRSELPEMRGNGRVQTAPHWLEALGTLAKNKVSNDMQNKALAGQQQMGQNAQSQNNMVLQALLRQPQPQPQPQPSNPYGMQNPYAQFLRGSGT